jgi:hypothetical protein
MNNKYNLLIICTKIKCKMVKLHSNLILYHKIKYHNNKTQEHLYIHQKRCQINKATNLSSLIIAQNHRSYQILLHIQNRNLIRLISMKQAAAIRKIYIEEKIIINKINNRW